MGAVGSCQAFAYGQFLRVRLPSVTLTSLEAREQNDGELGQLAQQCANR